VSERVLVGAGVGTGVSIAPAFIFRTERYVPWDSEAAGSSRGLVAIRSALTEVSNEIDEAREETDGDSAEILDALKLVLEDQSLMESIKVRLADGANTQRAVMGAFKVAAETLAQLGEYFAERSNDITELGQRVIDKLTGKEDLLWPTEPFVLVTDNLGPLEMVKLQKSSIVGLVSSLGSPTSHTSILARGMNLPTVVSVSGTEFIQSGDQLIVDSSSGQVLLKPDQSELQQYSKAAEESQPEVGLSIESLDLPVKLYANLGSSSEGDAAIAFGAQGVGLFRTELLFLGEKIAPSLETQVLEYSRLLQQFPDQVVIVRVLDLDTDKPLPFLKLTETGKYANRGFQALLANPEALKTQLTALSLASQKYPSAKLWVMAPMVSTAEQASEFVSMAKELGLETVGVMIEVPEVCEPEVLKKIVGVVDFLSIGTNDLTQYTLNHDRMDSPLPVSEVRSPEVLKLIQRVATACVEAELPLGICGEAASDPVSAKLFIDYGVTSLSASPALLPSLARELSCQ
jgi:phosphotransferase system enzyme I (PtsI)